MGKESVQQVHNRTCTEKTKQNYLSEREYKNPLLWETPADQIVDEASIFSDFEVYVWSDFPTDSRVVRMDVLFTEKHLCPITDSRTECRIIQKAYFFHRITSVTNQTHFRIYKHVSKRL